MEAIHLLSFGEGGWAAALLKAALVTLVLSTLGFILGALLGGLAAAGQLSQSRLLQHLAKGYCTVFRGVPDLLTIYLLYYGGSVLLTAAGQSLGFEGFISLPIFATGVLALGIISGAYQAEVYRGAYLAIDSGQADASHALGLSRRVTLRRIMIPQMLRIALPGIANVWQLILKDSALISVIGLVELMRQAQIAAGSTREPLMFYLAAGALYLVIASTTGRLFQRAEKHAARSVTAS
ncbi:MAG: ABC transporter permease subunit [Granulosicoccus sp.]|nr:ABC transporter permease subunit [Granulosicoccus sp.]